MAGAKWRLDNLTAVLVTELSKLRVIEVISRQDIRQMLVHEQDKLALGCDDASCLAEIGGALGILEAFSVASLIEGADAAAKAATVTLLEIRLAMALGGKAFATMTGDVASVQAAVDAGRQVIEQMGLLVNAVVIPRPHPDVYHEVV